MKRESFFFSFFLLLALVPAASDAQCSGGCMAGALTTLPATGGLAANTNYCIGGTVTNTTNFTITDTLVIQSGTVNLGAATLNSTGVIMVESGATLIVVLRPAFFRPARLPPAPAALPATAIY
jgi:hypothetical protein